MVRITHTLNPGGLHPSTVPRINSRITHFRSSHFLKSPTYCCMRLCGDILAQAITFINQDQVVQWEFRIKWLSSPERQFLILFLSTYFQYLVNSLIIGAWYMYITHLQPNNFIRNYMWWFCKDNVKVWPIVIAITYWVAWFLTVDLLNEYANYKENWNCYSEAS